jgi:hypothetical protein
LEAAECPWNDKNVLVRVTLRSVGAERDGSEATLCGVGVELRFAAEVVANYRLIACGEVSGAVEKPGAAPRNTPSPVPRDVRDWPAGQTVTALYELALHKTASFSEMDDASSRSKPNRRGEPPAARRLVAGVGCDSARGPLTSVHAAGLLRQAFTEASTDFRFAAAAAAFAMILRNPPHDAPALELDKLAAMAAAA